MPNRKLRVAMNAKGLSYDDLGELLRVNPKTVERWITLSRVPYPRHRDALVDALGQPEEYFWPSVTEPEHLGSDEIVEVYPHRGAIPEALWRTLLLTARRRIDLLVYAGRFLQERCPDLVADLGKKAVAGTSVRLLVGDPDCPAVAERAREEVVGRSLAADIRATVDAVEPLTRQPGAAVRVHRTTLYTSLFQFDDEMIVNPHVYGVPGAHAPALRLRRRRSAPLFKTYAMAFERVWQNAVPVVGEAGDHGGP